MDETRRPNDNFSLELQKWLDYPQATRVRPATLQTQTFLGHVETWTVQTVRHQDLGEAVFVQRISADGSLQLMLPPKVADKIAAQRDQITSANRRSGARRAIETKRAAGVPVGNADALRKARRKRGRV